MHYLGLIFEAVFRGTLDTAQTVIFVGVLVLGFLAVLGLSRKTIDMLTAQLTAGKAALFIVLAIVVTRLSIAPYWVWADEHAARVKAENDLTDALAQVPPRITFEVENVRALLFDQPVTGDFYLKIAVNYEGVGQATCHLYLTELSKDGNTIFRNEELMLTAEGGGNPPESQSFPFSNKAHHAYNLGVIRKGENKITVASNEYSNNYGDQILSAGTYLFQVKPEAANGQSCPTKFAEIAVKYDGKQSPSFLMERFKQWD